MWFAKKNKQPPTAEELEKKKQKGFRSAADQMMKMSADYEKSQVEAANSAARTWKRFGIGGFVVAGMGVAAVMGLTPLKEAVPFLIEKSEAGQTRILTTIQEKAMTFNEATNKYWSALYVINRESYDWYTVQSTYDTTLLMSSPAEQARFKSLYNSDAAPHKVLEKKARVMIKINSISFVGDVAQVRFEKRLLPVGSQDNITATPPERMIASVSFEFKPAKMDEEARLINPLGFQVLSYRVDSEVVK